MGIDADLSEREQECTDFELWPENEAPIALLNALGTQWHRAGMSGVATGLNYQSVPMLMRYLGISRTEQPDVFFALQIAEIAVLNIFHSEA